MPAQIVPLTNSPGVSFNVNLSVDGGVLQLRLSIKFSEMAGYWIMSISNQQGVLILDSIPLLTGTWPAANILGQYGYLKIGSAFVINVSNITEDLKDYPSSSNLGSDFCLLWDDTAV